MIRRAHSRSNGFEQALFFFALTPRLVPLHSDYDSLAVSG
jgi:hypothetical protein